jgi:hypothetical protein
MLSTVGLVAYQHGHCRFWSIAFFKSIFNLGCVFRRLAIKMLKISTLNAPWQGVPLSTYPKNDIFIPIRAVVIIMAKQKVKHKALQPSPPCQPVNPMLPPPIQDPAL